MTKDNGWYVDPWMQVFQHWKEFAALFPPINLRRVLPGNPFCVVRDRALSVMAGTKAREQKSGKKGQETEDHHPPHPPTQKRPNPPTEHSYITLSAPVPKQTRLTIICLYLSSEKDVKFYIFPSKQSVVIAAPSNCVSEPLDGKGLPGKKILRYYS